MGVLVRQLGKKKGRGHPWYAVMNHRGERGYKKFPTKAEAKKFAKDARQKLAKGEMFRTKKGPSLETLESFSLDWIEKHCRERNLKPRTYESYLQELKKHILPALGFRPVIEITRGEVREFLDRKAAEGLSPRTVDYLRTILTTIFNTAREREIRTDNPAERFGRGKRVGKNKVAKILTEEEENKLLSLVYEKDPEYFAVLLTSLRTVVRRGEVVALRWEDLDWENALLRVRRSIDLKGRIGTPKNGKERVTAVSSQLAGVLAWHKRRIEASEYHSSPWMFPNPVRKDGGPVKGDHLLKKFREWLEEAGIERRRWHDIRHSGVTRALEKGAEIALVSKFAGHSNIGITADMYGHIRPKFLGGVVGVLDDPSLKCLVESNAIPVRAEGTADASQARVEGADEGLNGDSEAVSA